MVYENYRNLCSGQPAITRKHDKSLKWLFKNIGETNIKVSSTPQHEAACWMFRQSKGFSPQRYVMAVIYYATKGAKWDINTDWMTQKHECSWYGVECSTFKKVVGLDLGYIKVDGLVPREIGLLTELRDLDLHGNDLQGVIPHKLMVGLKKLQYLRLHMNGMFGAIHKEITNMKNLKELYAFGNYIAGTIPKELAQLKKLGK
jgi:Leucine-rich repeat (LRR) protein